MVLFRKTLRECLLPAVSPSTEAVIGGALKVLAETTVLDFIGTCRFAKIE